MPSRSDYHAGETPRLGPLSSGELFARMRAEADHRAQPDVEGLSLVQLTYLNRELLKVFDVSGLFVEILNKNREFIYVNRAFTERFGYRLEDLEGMTPCDLRPPDTEPLSREAVTHRVVEQEQVWEGDYERYDINGLRVTFAARIAPLRNEEGVIDAFILIGSESGPRPADYVQLERIAFEDALTGLPNRLLFEDRLRHRISRAHRQPELLGALLFVDIDAFKSINDQYGHGAGDRVLIELGQRLQLGIRATDTVCRYGGDEFVILLDNINDRTNASTCASELSRNISQPVVLGPNLRIIPTASIGITYITPPGRGVDVLMREADAAMYQAKTSGAPYIVFDEALDEESRRTRNIRKALSNPAGLHDLELYLRPVIDCHSGNIAELCVTAMLQLDGETQSPAEAWLDAAEASGTSPEILCWVLRAAAAFDDSLTDQPCTYRYPLQLPMTPRGACSHSVVELITELSIARPTLSFVFIVCDNGAPLDSPAVREALEHIRSLGHRIILDHFGRGALPFDSITALPLDGFRLTPKISETAHQDKRQAAMVRAIQRFSLETGYTLSASGVDCPDLLSWFERNDWSLLQGDAVGTYMPAARMLDWLTLQPLHTPSNEPPTYS